MQTVPTQSSGASPPLAPSKGKGEQRRGHENSSDPAGSLLEGDHGMDGYFRLQQRMLLATLALTALALLGHESSGLEEHFVIGQSPNEVQLEEVGK